MEFAAEMHDFIVQDVQRYFPDLEPLVNITLIEATNVILGGFSKQLSEYTMKLFKKRRIEVLTGMTVKEVKRHTMLLSSGMHVTASVCVCARARACP